jgi:hypothetical protein
MDQFTSPDLPAYLCYLLVLIIAMLVARSQVNRLLASFPERWGFLSTWGLFSGHVGVPLGLFWFLDYTDALRDTSLFGALLVAIGYRQIFIGGVDSIRLPGQTQRLWQPFERWVKLLVEHITWKLKSHLDRFDDRVCSYVAADSQRIQGLAAIAFLHTTSKQDLETALATLEAETRPNGVSEAAFTAIQNRKRITLLMNDLRASTGENFGYFLYQGGVVPTTKYLLWFGNVRSRGVAWAATVIVAALLILGSYFAYQSLSVKAWYYQWRFTKANSSEMDRFRSRNYFQSQLRAAAEANNRAHIEAVLAPMLVKLRFKECPNRVAEDVLRLAVDCHNPAIDAVVFPQLIESLRTENSDIRLRMQRSLIDLYHADYCAPSAAAPEGSAAAMTCKPELEEGIIDWVPANDDSPGKIDTYVRAWQAWWARAHAIANVAAGNTP